MTLENPSAQQDPNKREEPPIEVSNPSVEDAADQRHGITAPPSGGDREPEPQPRQQPTFKSDRADIAKRFAERRAAKEAGIESTGDHTDPSQTYGNLGLPQPEPEPEPEPQPEPAPASQTKFKVKVRGEERELTQEELVAAAQIGLAGESYLREARSVLESAEQRVRVSRRHPDEPEPAAQRTESDDPDADHQHPDDGLEELANDLQYKDPKEAAETLRNTLPKLVANEVKKVTVNDRVQEDTAQDLRAFEKFKEANADLAADKNASAVIRENLLDGYREDLRKIGVPEEKIPTDPQQLARHHREYKLQGQPVRQVATLLEAAKQTYLDWRGPAQRKEDPKPAPQPQTRVSVSVDRDERRRALPHQPTRAAVPSQLMNPPAPDQSTSRKQAVLNARKARGQIVAT